MFAKKCEDLFPTIERLLYPVHGAVVVKDAVACAVIAVKLVVLTVLLEFGLVKVDLFWTWRAVFIAEDPEERA